MHLTNKIKAKRLLKSWGVSPTPKPVHKIVLKKTSNFVATKDVRELISKINNRNDERFKYLLEKIRGIKVEPKLERIEIIKPELRTEIVREVKELDTKELKKTNEDLEDLKRFVFERVQYWRGGGSPNQRITVGGTVMSNRYADFNLVGGTGVSISAADDNTDKNVDITFTAGGLSPMVPTGDVDGSNTIFTFTTAPSIIVVDQGRAMQKTSSDSTVNWTGTTTITLAIAPNFDIYGI